MFGFTTQNHKDTDKIPCHNCPHRQVGCHATCKLYFEWQANHAKVVYEEKLKRRGDAIAFTPDPDWMRR